MLLINDVALRANRIEPFAWFAEIQLIFNQKCGTMKAKKSGYIDDQRYKTLERKFSTIRFLLVRSITTAKKKLKSGKEDFKPI